jgi:hypothetical protein
LEALEASLRNHTPGVRKPCADCRSKQGKKEDAVSHDDAVSLDEAASGDEANEEVEAASQEEPASKGFRTKVKVLDFFMKFLSVDYL